MAVSEAPASAGALVTPQYGASAGASHTHPKEGGGTVTHEHADAPPGHGHPDIALLPMQGGKAAGFLFDFEIKSAEPLDEKAAREAGVEKGTLVLKGYANTWDVDRDEEQTARDAFDSTLDEYMSNPVVLWAHRENHEIGYVTEARTDQKGLWVKALIPPPIDKAPAWHHKVYNDIKRRVLRTFSMGGVFVKSQSVRGLIEKVKLYEVSVVGVPANQTSLFDVAAVKGLRWSEKAPQQPGVGRGHGRHHHGPLGARGNRHPRGAARKPHAHGASGSHIPVPGLQGGKLRVGAHPSYSVTLGHKPSDEVAAELAKWSEAHGVSYSVIYPGGHLTSGGKATDPVDTGGTDTPEDEEEEQEARGEIGELIEGLVEAIEEINQSDQTDEQKIENVSTLLTEFQDEAGERLSGDDNEEDGDEPAKALLAVLDTKGAAAAARHIENALRRTEDTGMADDDQGTKAATVAIDRKEWETTQSALTDLLREKSERDMEVKAEKEAQRRLDAEAKAEQERKAAEEAQAKQVNDLVEQKMAAMRGALTTGVKYRQAAQAGDAPHPLIGGNVLRPKTKGFSAWLRDLRDAKKGNFEAYQRLEEQQAKAAEFYATDEDGDIDTKALQEASTTGGGFLVPPQYWQAGIAEYRLAAAKVRRLITVISQVNSNLVYIPRETGVSTVGWTAENAAKPSTDQAFGQIAVNIFTLAGISKVSNQLLADSSPAVDQIVRKDLGRVLGQAEDIAFINGSGVGQPTGILQTSGVLTVAYSAPAAGSGLGDAISAAITAIDSNFFDLPTAILAHPRMIQKLRQVKDTQGRYIFEAGWAIGIGPWAGGAQSFVAAGAGNIPGTQTAAGGATLGGPVGSVWGLPVYSDANIPTNLNWTGSAYTGGGAESPIIVGVWEEAYALERMGVALDVSNEAGTSFEQNQTWFRGEERVGFTAARQPTAFCFITGLTNAIAG